MMKVKMQPFGGQVSKLAAVNGGMPSISVANLEEVGDFATKIGRRNLINIQTNGRQVLVWYWEYEKEEEEVAIAEGM